MPYLLKILAAKSGEFCVGTRLVNLLFICIHAFHSLILNSLTSFDTTVIDTITAMIANPTSAVIHH